VLLLSKEFLKWVCYSNAIAWPLGYFIMDRWLQNFAYRIHLEWHFFIIFGTIALSVSIITVSSQVLKTARANPADSLRYE
jgi:putative ABC transport system permease protein